MTSASWSADVKSLCSDHLPTYIVIQGIGGGPQTFRSCSTNWDKFRDMLEGGSATFTTHGKFADAISSAKACPKDAVCFTKRYQQ